MNQTLEKVLYTCQKTGINKIFVNGSKARSYPTRGYLFEFGSESVKMLYKINIAILPSEKVMKEIRFFTMAINNRGGQMKLFDTEENALNYLIGL